MINIYVDGGCKSNQIPERREAYGSYIIMKNGIALSSKKMNYGNKTNNESEYLSVIMSVLGVIDYFENYPEPDSVTINTDSQLVVNHYQNAWQCTEHLVIYRDILKIFLKDKGYKIKYVPREEIVKILGH